MPRGNTNQAGTQLWVVHGKMKDQHQHVESKCNKLTTRRMSTDVSLIFENSETQCEYNTSQICLADRCDLCFFSFAGLKELL